MNSIEALSTHRLGNYLTTALGIGALASTSDAAIVNLDISSISGTNAGLDAGDWKTVDLSTLDSTLSGAFTFRNGTGNNEYQFTGIEADYGAAIATGYYTATPRKLVSGALIDIFLNAGGSLGWFTPAGADSAFRAVFWEEIPGSPPDYQPSWSPLGTYNSPDFGAGSFLGFVDANERYGWLEVTWDNATGNFEILSGAFENVPGVGIQAGATAAVPEPAGAFGTLGLLAAGAFVRRRRQAA